MKITDLKLSDPIYVTSVPTADAIHSSPAVRSYTFLEVYTDDGIIGMSGFFGADSLSSALIEDTLKSQVVGEDPVNTERIWDKMYWATLMSGRRGATISAIGAIDIALWDLKGKIVNLPVHKLLGGHRDIVPSYGSGINLNYTSEELAEQMTRYVESGHEMVKIKIGKRDPDEDLERIELVRNTIGPKVKLAVDVNNGWSINTAISMAEKIEKYDIYWLEEPILVDEIANMAKLADETSIPIAAGENHYTKWEFKDLMERGAVEVVQPNVRKCGGVTEFVKIAAMADAYGLPVCPHHTEYIDVALAAAIPNGLLHEYIETSFDPIGHLFVDPIKPENGKISPSMKPGFGIEIDRESLEKLKTKPGTESLVPGTTKRGWRWPPFL